MRLWGVPESELAARMREHDAELGGLEITTCLRGGELEIVSRFAPDAQDAYDGFEKLIGASFQRELFSTDGRTVDDIVADALLERGLTIATAESCTAGGLASRLTDRPGSSAYLLGGMVVYSNAMKTELAGVPAELDRARRRGERGGRARPRRGCPRPSRRGPRRRHHRHRRAGRRHRRQAGRPGALLRGERPEPLHAR